MFVLSRTKSQKVLDIIYIYIYNIYIYILMIVRGLLFTVYFVLLKVCVILCILFDIDQWQFDFTISYPVIDGLKECVL